MLRKRFVIILFLVLCLPCFADDQFAPGQILVKFKPDVVSFEGNAGMMTFSADKAFISSDSIKALNAKHGVFRFRSFAKKERKFKTLRSGRTVELPDLSQIYLIEFPKDADVQLIADEYGRDPSVEYASPNYIRKLYTTPNDPFYISDPNHDPNQWGLYKIWLGPLESGNTGWQFTTGESTVKVAIIDTGVNYNHVDLSSRIDILDGIRLISGDPSTDPMDDIGHGTHVAGIIGAETNNGIGVAGIDWNCEIIPIKVFSSSGGTDFDIANGLYWAANKDAKVVNMSFGPKNPNDSGYDPIVEAAISYAATSDCVLVAAAGNDDRQTPAKYPAHYPHVIAVAATGPNDEKAFYSNYGNWITVSAPGGDNSGLLYDHEILSTIPNSTISDGSYYGTPPNTSYGYLQGTSMATPFVSGLAALVRAKFPTMEADEVAQRIIVSADNIDAVSGYPGLMGSGRINAFSALGGLYGNITFPISSTVAIGNITILGSATGEGFVSYEVDSGRGANPISWKEVASSTSSVNNGTLATFDSTGLDGPVTIKLTLNALPTKVTEVTFQVGSSESSILTDNRPQYGPNPFDPKKENIMIMYTMTANADVYIYFFDIAGHQICRKWYPSGTQGGSSGTNRVYWDGKNDYGETAANGVYLFRIFSDNRTIGKGKIVVVK